jgi:signal transduction histidine kinase
MLERLAQEFQYGHPNVTIEREWGDDVPPVHGSRAQLERSFHNLMINAGRAMADGGTLTLRTRGEIVPQDEAGTGGWVAVDIADTGVGISPAMLEKIFRIGFSEWKDGKKGSGLGLYVARRNIENHNGAIEMASEVGRGTTVTVHLPVQRESTPSGTTSL